MFSGVIDVLAGLLELAIDSGAIPGKGGYFTWDGQKFHGLAALKEFFEMNTDQALVLRELVKSDLVEDVSSEEGEEGPLIVAPGMTGPEDVGG